MRKAMTHEAATLCWVIIRSGTKAVSPLIQSHIMKTMVVAPQPARRPMILGLLQGICYEMLERVDTKDGKKHTCSEYCKAKKSITKAPRIKILPIISSWGIFFLSGTSDAAVFLGLKKNIMAMILNPPMGRLK